MFSRGERAFASEAGRLAAPAESAPAGVAATTAPAYSEPSGVGDWVGASTGGAQRLNNSGAAVSATGFVNTANDKDWYAVTLTAGQTYQFSLDGSAGLDAYLELRNSSGTLLASNDDGGSGTDSTLSYTAATGGTFYVSAGGYGTSTGSYTLDVAPIDVLDTIDWGTKIADAAVVNVYFAPAGVSYDGDTSMGWNSYEIQQVMNVLQQYENVCAIDFVITTDPTVADLKLLIAPTSDEALGYFNPPGEADAGWGVFYRSGTGWDELGGGGLQQGGYGYVTLLHELGHGLGMAHPHDNGGGSPIMPGVTDDFDSYGANNLNQGVFTVMTYNDGWALSPTPLGAFVTTYGYEGTPMALDIALLQQKYGANTTYNSGDNTYVLPHGDGAGVMYACIWDTGGVDTIVAEGSNRAVIDLRPATIDFSSTGGGVVSYIFGTHGGFTIAQGVVIENATGGDGDDSITGNDAANTLRGGLGADTLSGGLGADVLDGGAGDDSLSGGEGDDTYVVDSLGDRLTDTGNGVDTVRAAVSWTLEAAFENLVLTGAAALNGTGNFLNNVITGNDGANTLSGGLGDDVLSGGLGNDVLDGGYGSDVMDGGLGDDTYIVDFAGDSISADAGGVDTVRSSATWILGAGLENLILTGAGSVDGTGNALANTIVGNDGDNVLDGGAGADVLQGGLGDDTYVVDNAGDMISDTGGVDTIRTLFSWTLGADFENLTLTGSAALNGTGNALANVITGNAGANRLEGGLGADRLSGGDGADQLIGGDGDDVLDGGNLADLIDGGAGKDTASYASAAAGVTVNLNKTTAQATFGAGSDTLTSIENLTGSAFADNLRGNAGANVLTGGAGDDVIEGGGGADVLDGGAGIDTASYINTAGSGVVATLSGATGGAGTDVLLGFENLIGTRYDDQLTGDAGSNVLEGRGGADLLVGGAGDDRLDGGTGADAVSYAAATGGVTVNLNALGVAQNTGGAGVDTLLSIDQVIGSAFNDSLRGNAGSNVLTGGAGDDVLEGGGGHDKINGGDGIDTASYANTAGGVGVTVDLNRTTAQVTNGAGSDTLSGIENLTGSRYADVLRGDAGNNVLSGGSGDDLLEGGAGNDTLDGGLNVDTASYAGAGAGVSVNLAQAGAQNTIGAGTDTLVSIENLTGSAFADRLYGTNGANTLIGGAGDDLLEGGGGDDRLEGGTGTDTASYVGAGAAVSVNLNAAGGVQATGAAGTDTFVSIENVTGSAFNDNLRGNALDNVLSGGVGDDVLEGGGGDDRLEGGFGIDTASYANAASGVTVDLTLTGAQATGAAGADTLTSIENLTGSAFADTLRGDANTNTLTGGAGADVLVGGGGGDTFVGGLGADTMTAGAGADTFRFTAGDGQDVIDGFEVGTDQLVITGYTTWTEIRQVGDDALVVFSATDSILLKNVTAATFTPAIVGTPGADTISGGDASDFVHGLGGDDILSGAGGDDVLEGGDGDDLLAGGAGDDGLDGGAGVDTASYAGAAATAGVRVNLSLSGAQDTGGAGTDTLTGVENLQGTAWDDTLTGDAGANRLDGGAGGDLLTGGPGDDTYVVDSWLDSVIELAGEGTDTVLTDMAAYAVAAGIEVLTGTAASGQQLTGNALNNLITGGAGDDDLRGAGGDDHLVGGEGNDVLGSGLGADVLEGGAGIDTVDYGIAVMGSVGVTVDLTRGGAQDTEGAGVDTLSGIENLLGSVHADTLSGDAGANTLSGLGGDDVLRGRGGADVLTGGDGADRFVFGLGDGADTVTDFVAGQDQLQVTGYYGYQSLQQVGADTLVVLSGVDSILLQGVAAASLTAGDFVFDTPAVETPTIQGTSAGDALSGTVGADVIYGLGGGDNLQGGAGDDIIRGGDGDDMIIEFDGNDVIDGGVGKDLLVFFGATAGVTVDLTITGPQNTGGAGIDTISGVESLSGTAFNDVLTGDAAANTLSGSFGDDVLMGAGGTDILSGEAGNDMLYGGDGNDTIAGDAGDDFVDGGAGVDFLSYAGVSAGVTVSLLVSGAQDTGGAGMDTIVGVESLQGSVHADRLTGDDGANALFGFDGNDILIGGGGADQMTGGAGNDRVEGGAGNDVLRGNDGDDLFVFAAGSGQDEVVDFTAGGTADSLDFSAYAGTGITFSLDQVGADTVFTFSNGDTVTLTGVTSAALVQIDTWHWG